MMLSSRLGVAGKLNLAIGAVLLSGTLIFAVIYSFLEKEKRIALDREHIQHLAAAVSWNLESVRDRIELQAALDKISERLEEYTGMVHQLVVRDNGGELLASSRSGSESSGSLSWLLKRTIPISMNTYSETTGGVPAYLDVSEDAGHLQVVFRESLLRHILFALLLTGIVLFATSACMKWIIIDPVRKLVIVTSDFAQDGSWDPIRPDVRRNDEIGTLANRLAEMSRRLREAVREERSGVAEVVGLRVHRDLDEPLRKLATHISSLTKFLPADSKADRVRIEIETDLDQIREHVRELENLGEPSRRS